MAVEIKVPSFGESVSEGVLTRWLKKDGELVRRDAPVGERETRQRMSPLRQRIASRLLESQQTTASLTTFNEADMSAINTLRAAYKDKFKEKHGVNLGFMSFFVKAVVEALRAFPAVNGR